MPGIDFLRCDRFRARAQDNYILGDPHFWVQSELGKRRPLDCQFIQVYTLLCRKAVREIHRGTNSWQNYPSTMIEQKWICKAVCQQEVNPELFPTAIKKVYSCHQVCVSVFQGCKNKSLQRSLKTIEIYPLAILETKKPKSMVSVVMLPLKTPAKNYSLDLSSGW